MNRSRNIRWFAAAIIMLLIAFAAPLVVTELRFGGAQGVIHAEPAEFQNMYGQGVVQGLVGVVPVLINFWLATLFWEHRSQAERRRTAARNLQRYFQQTRELAAEATTAIESRKLSPRQVDAEVRARLHILNRLAGEPVYYTAHLELDVNEDWADRLTTEWNTVYRVLAALAATEDVFGDLGDLAMLSKQLEKTQQACVRAGLILKGITR